MYCRVNRDDRFLWLSSLNFRLLQCDETEKAISMYLCELSLVEYHMLKFKPSVVAAASLYVALKMMKKGDTWRRLSDNEDLIKMCAKELLVLVQAAGSHPLAAVRTKFSGEEFFCVSTLSP